MPFRTYKNKGFSLVELAISLTIVSILISYIIGVIPGQTNMNNYNNVSLKLTKIQSAIDAFYNQNGYIPCPSSLTANYGAGSSPYIGISGACTGTASSGITSINSGTVWIGSIPTRTLNLPDSYMLDAWGNRIEYAVTTGLAQSQTLFSNYASSTAPLKIVDATSTQINTDTLTTTAGAAVVVAYSLYSHGKDGSGATNSQGTASTCPASTSHYDKENCNADYTFMDSTYNPNTSTFYDDIVVWKTNQQQSKDGSYSKGTTATATATGGFTKVTIYAETYPDGSNPGACTSRAYNLRKLNTVLRYDPSINAMINLSTSTITLGPGTYFVRGSAPTIQCNHNVLTLQNITTGNIMYGSIAYSGTMAQVRSEISYIFTLNTQSDFQLQHWISACQGTSYDLGTNLGYNIAPGSPYGSTPYYISYLEIWQ